VNLMALIFFSGDMYMNYMCMCIHYLILFLAMCLRINIMFKHSCFYVFTESQYVCNMDQDDCQIIKKETRVKSKLKQVDNWNINLGLLKKKTSL
jgi:hypothetical protein